MWADAQVEAFGLRLIRVRMLHLRSAEAREFYRVHEGKPFLDDLVSFMSRSPIVACVVEGESAISDLRGLMGATDPSKAEPGTLRARFGRSIRENAEIFEYCLRGSAFS